MQTEKLKYIFIGILVTGVTGSMMYLVLGNMGGWNDLNVFGSSRVKARSTDIDTDGDGLSNKEELETYNTDPWSMDTDYDGLMDQEEIYLGTDPNEADTDNDGFKDGTEVDNNYDPTDPDPLARLDEKGEVIKTKFDEVTDQIMAGEEPDMDGLEDELVVDDSSLRSMAHDMGVDSSRIRGLENVEISEDEMNIIDENSPEAINEYIEEASSMFLDKFPIKDNTEWGTLYDLIASNNLDQLAGYAGGFTDLYDSFSGLEVPNNEDTINFQGDIMSNTLNLINIIPTTGSLVDNPEESLDTLMAYRGLIGESNSMVNSFNEISSKYNLNIPELNLNRTSSPPIAIDTPEGLETLTGMSL